MMGEHGDMNKEIDMTRRFASQIVLSFVLLGAVSVHAADAPSPARPWKNGLPTDPSFFPLAVWLQAPHNAARFKEAGINLYVGLWEGPTDAQLSALRAVGMPVICDQNDVGLNSPHADIIVGWMHGDEPDNAQPLPNDKGYGPPILPKVIETNYRTITQRDPTRPVLLNLGQGVAFDQYIGRGVRRNHPEDYSEYIRGCDIVSFDIYPAVHDHPDVAGKLEYVANGVDRLRKWSGDEKIVWNCIECSRIGNTKTKPTPQQIRAEVWMSLIHGSRGLIYFVHQFEPRFIEASLLEDTELLAAVTSINRQVHELAPVLNSPDVRDAVAVTSSETDVPVDILCKQQGDATYVFAVCMRNRPTRVTLQWSQSFEATEVEVLGENRTLPLRDGRCEDAFQPYEVHLYRVAHSR
jgi:hypothetical protein